MKFTIVTVASALIVAWLIGAYLFTVNNNIMSCNGDFRFNPLTLGLTGKCEKVKL